MKKLLLILGLTLISFSAFSKENAKMELLELECNGNLGKLDVTVNKSANTILVSDAEAFGFAQILVNVPMGMKIEYGEDFQKIHFEYNWYFNAEYDLTLHSSPVDLKKGSKLSATLSGDDYDGAFFDEEKFECVVK